MARLNYEEIDKRVYNVVELNKPDPSNLLLFIEILAGTRGAEAQEIDRARRLIQRLRRKGYIGAAKGTEDGQEKEGIAVLVRTDGGSILQVAGRDREFAAFGPDHWRPTGDRGVLGTLERSRRGDPGLGLPRRLRLSPSRGVTSLYGRAGRGNHRRLGRRNQGQKR